MINAKGEIVDVKWSITHHPTNHGREYSWSLSTKARGYEHGYCKNYIDAESEITRRVAAANLDIPPTIKSGETISNQDG